MKANKQYICSDGLQYAMLPFTKLCITQGSRTWSHSGCMAMDVVNESPSVNRAPYYAPFDCVCKAIYPSYGQSWWQSTKKVHIANGKTDYVNIMIAHDDSQDCYVGQHIAQGAQIGNMGTRGIGTGIHCHIQVGIGVGVTWGNVKGYFNFNGVTYPCYGFSNEPYDLDDVFFCDDTQIIYGAGGNWRKCNATVTKQTEPKPTNEGEWIDGIVKVGSIVKSKSLAIQGIKNGCVICNELGGLVPMSDVSEASDTKDGKCDGVLATTAARIYLDPCTVQSIDAKNDLVKVHGYWIKAKPLLVKK